MNDYNKTKAELLQELAELRQEVTQLKALEVECLELKNQLGVAKPGSEPLSVEQILPQNEVILRTIIDSTPDWIFIKDREHRYRLVNQSYANSLHLTPTDFIGKNDLELGFPEDIVKGNPAKGIRGFWADDREVMDSGQTKFITEEPAMVDGQPVFLSTVKVPLQDTHGQVWGVLGFVHDITERKQAEQALQRQQEFLTKIIENLPVAIFTKDAQNEYRFSIFNAKMEELFGVKREAMLGKNDYDLFETEAEADYYRQTDVAVLEGGQVVDIPLEEVTTNRGLMLAHTIKVPIYDSEGKPEILLGILDDITERKRAEETLHQSETRNRVLLNAIPDLIIRYRADGTYLDVKPSKDFQAFHPPSELIGKNLFEVAPPDVAQKRMHHIQLALQTGQTQTYEHSFSREGKTRFEEIWVVPSEVADEVFVVIRDMTERRQAEETLRQNEALLRTVIDSTPDWIFIKDQNHRYRLVNQSYANSMHLLPEDFVGKNDLEIGFPEEIVKGNAEKGIKGFWADDREVMDSGETKFIAEEPAVLDGQPAFLNTIKVPLRDVQNQVSGVLGFVQNITERKQAEEALARRAAELETVARVGTAASTILEIDKLLQEVVDLTKSSFNLYHAHVYLLNQARDTLVLAAGAGEVGQQMVSQGWSIPLERERSLVAQAARNRQGVIVNDVRKEPDFLPNPLLPETRAEMAIAMIVGDRVLGVLDVQADKVDYFTAEDVQIQTILAGQIAAALQNARSFAEQQQARLLLDERVKELNCLNEIGREIAETPPVPELLQWVTGRIPPAMRYPELCVAAIEYDGQMYGVLEAIELPCQIVHALRVSGEVVGRVTIAYTEKREFLDEESALIGGIAGRLGGYIESRRLFEQVQDALTGQERLTVQFDTQRRTLQAVLDNMPAGVVVVEAPSGKPLLANERAKQLLGRGIMLDTSKRETAEMYAAYRYGTEALYPPDQTPLARGLAGESSTIDDMEIRRKGSRVLLQVNGAPIRDAAGHITASVAIYQDITERKQAEEELSKRTAELEESQTFLDSVIENLPVMLFIKEAKELRHVRWNKTGLELLGRKPEEMIGKNDYDFFPKEEADFFAAKDREALAKGELVEIPEESIESVDKGTRWLYTRKTPIYGPDGQPKYLLGISVDITERKQAAETLKESEERFRVIAETAPIPILISSISDGLILYGNEQLGQTFGLTTAKLIGQQTPDFYYDPADRAPMLATFKRDGKLHDYELHVKKADGTPFWVLVSMQPLVFAGQPAMLAAFYDVTERKETEEMLRRSQEQLSRALETAKLAYWEADMATMMFTFNDQFYSLLRTTAQQEGGYLMPVMQYAQKFVHPDDAYAVGAEIQKSVETTDPNYSGWAEHRIIRADGSEGHVIVRFRVVKDEQGRTVKTIGANQDITELKQAEETLRQNEALLRTVIDSTPDWIFIKDHDHRYRLVNQSYAASMHLLPEDFVGKNDLEIGFPEEIVKGNAEKGIKGFWADDREVMASGETKFIAEEPAVLDGQSAFLSTIKVPLRDAQNQVWGVLGFVQNITERKQAEKVLEQLRRQNELILNTASVGIYGLDLKGNTTFVNPLGAQLVGYEPEEMIGKPQHALIHHTHADGTPYPREECYIYAALRDGAVHQVDTEVFWRKDSSSFPVEYTSTPIFNDQGEITGAVVVFQDITERKQVEEALKKEQEWAQTILESVTVPMVISRVPDGTILYANDPHSRFFSIPREQLIGQPTRNFFEDPAERDKFVALLRSQGAVNDYEVGIRKSNGELRWVLVSSRLFNFRGEAATMTIMIDITDRKQAEAERERLLGEVEATYRQYVRREWEQFLGEQHQGNWRIEHQALGQPAEPAPEGWAEMQAEVIREGKTKVITGTGGNGHQAEPAIVAPIALRGQVIGTLSLQDIAPDRQWTAEEMALVETVSEQLALTVENLRLFDDTQKRATREQLTRQITDQLRAAPNIDSIIQTGLTELAKALKVSRTYVKLSTKPENE